MNITEVEFKKVEEELALKKQTQEEQFNIALNSLSPEELECYKNLPRLQVWYGLRKLTKKVVKKKSLCCIYENSYFHKNQTAVNRAIHVFYKRDQTPSEKIAAAYSTNMRTLYFAEYCLDNKKFKGDIEKCINAFFRT